jgi:hypothetical protein
MNVARLRMDMKLSYHARERTNEFLVIATDVKVYLPLLMAENVRKVSVSECEFSCFGGQIVCNGHFNSV